MSTQNKMASDYLWVRHAPTEEGSKVRTHGYSYLYNRAPNRIERLESIYRSIGKTYDWELEKFRLSKKSVDKANKRRMIRNFARFVKSPIAYLFWATSRWVAASQPRVLYIFLAMTWAGALYEWKSNSNKIKDHDHLLMAQGQNVSAMSGREIGYHDTKPLRGPASWGLFFRAPITDDMVIINQTWKQNLRKELQLTNYHNVLF